MIARCHHPQAKSYERYGAVGIVVCKRWHKYENFLHDMGHPPVGMVLDRRENTKGYTPSNCRWATYRLSTENRRNSVWIMLNGRKLRAMEVARIIGCSESFVYQEAKKGKTGDDIAALVGTLRKSRHRNP